jgi:hypothetical protein
MTYVEFFDKIASKNISSCLTCVPDRVIFVGDNAKQMERHVAKYRRVFSDRGHNIEFLWRTASQSNLDHAVSVLTDLVETYDDCVFDITGGQEILMLALGVVFARFPEKNIQIHRFNMGSNTVADCDKDGNTVYREPPVLTVEENVRIFGGDILYSDVDGAETYIWDLNPEFLRDLDLIWDVCKGNVRYWNMQIGILESAQNIGNISADGLTTTVSMAALEHYLAQRKAKYKQAKGILSTLLKAGLITYFDDETDDRVTVSYKNKQVRKCLTKACQALEMKIFVTAKNVRDKQGLLVYDDALNGVLIDWDGTFHDEDAEQIYDTENEIDILLMHQTVPVFISCKNGVVTADELYKLSTVAERFGGQQAKKVLVATSLDSMGEAGKYVRQRAVDMGIRLVEKVQKMDDEELAKKIRNLLSN